MKNILSLILVSSFIFVSCDNGTAQQKTTDSKTKSTASSQKSNEGKKTGWN
jgi:PBP1b-binding outer membrane lipoprotein LpoB